MDKFYALVGGWAVKDAFPVLTDELEFVDVHLLCYFTPSHPCLEGARHVLREHVIHLHGAQRVSA